ncbi:MAG TPA: PepSY domain-containing protein [Beijerinckiaceae bacterium]|nr:PepSY domain-containing protein [Beijerinckiaceae bacterium]
MPRLAGAVALACALALATPALADRAPTPEERSRIESVLRAEGFSRWDDIELDDGVWEVDDAVGPDGREYDLKLDPNTLAILERKPD